MRCWLVIVLIAGCRGGDHDRVCDGAKPYCTDRTLIVCHQERDQWEEAPCSDYCIEADGHAFCASETTPRAACAGRSPGEIVCDGAERVECLDSGFVKILNTCAAADLCAPDLDVGCSALPGPQPECMERVPLMSNPPVLASFCRGDTAYSCSGTYAILPVTCKTSAGYVCRETSQSGACTHPAIEIFCDDIANPYPYAKCYRATVAGRCLLRYSIQDSVVMCPGNCGAGVCL